MIIKLFKIIFTLLLSIASIPPAHASFDFTGFMETEEYKADKQISDAMLYFYHDINFDRNSEKMTNIRLPYKQAATIDSSKLWLSDMKNFCHKVEFGKYNELRSQVDTNIVSEGLAMQEFGNDFQYTQLLSACRKKTQFITDIINGGDNTWFEDKVPHKLAFYKEQLDRASSSKVFLSKVFADTSGSSHTTLQSVKSSLETMISVHEIFADNKISKQWRNEFNELNGVYKDIQNNFASDIAKKFKKPRDLYKDLDKKEALTTTISQLLNAESGIDSAEIILADDDLRHGLILTSMTEGIEYDAIAFYALVNSKNKTTLHYGWYQKDTGTSNEFIKIVRSEDFENTAEIQTSQQSSTEVNSVGPTKEELSAQIDSEKAAITEETNRLLEQAKNQNQQYSSNGSSSSFSIISMLSALMMILAGLLLSRRNLIRLLPRTISDPIYYSLSKISPLATVIGFILLALGLYGLLMSLISFHLMSVVFSIITILAGLTLSIDKLLHFDATSFKGSEETAEKIKHLLQQHSKKLTMMEAQRLPIGIASLVIGIYQLIF